MNMNEIAKKVTCKLCQSQELSSFSKEIQLAVSQILWDVLTFIVASACVYVVYGSIQFPLIFSIFFLPLHRVAGGAHAQTHSKCMGSTVIMFLICAYYFFNNTSVIFTIAAVAAWTVIWKFAPITTKNHVLTIGQTEKNRNMSHNILLLYLFLSIMSAQASFHVAKYIQLVLIIVALLMISGINMKSKLFDCQQKAAYFAHHKVAQAILLFCLVTCYNTVNMASNHWQYQDEIESDLRRKFDDMR